VLPTVSFKPATPERLVVYISILEGTTPTLTGPSTIVEIEVDGRY
jgi:hypothetical protein